jgi:Protein of unknown function (DUF3237)
MSTSLREGLPEALKHLQVKPLFLMRLSVSPPAVPGQTPNGFRRVGVIQGGSFEGERLSGEVLAGGNDWQTIRSDRCIKLDVRLVLRTDDNALIGMTYQALRSGPGEVMERLDKGRGRRPRELLFPHDCIVRDRRAEVRLDQPHHCGGHGRAARRRADLQPL